jgi:4-hydroxy-4-methyl-2-oxoglutarate aldolase
VTTTLDGEEILELQRRWDRIRIANLYDALDRMGYGNQCIDLDIRPLFPGQHLAGMAVTLRGVRDPKDYHSQPKAAEGEAAHQPPDVRTLLFPGSVLVIDGGGEKLTGKMGEMTSWSFKQAGAMGIVIDGYIRDRHGLEVIPGYCTCARGTSPIESAGRWHVDAVNVPIALPGTLTSQVAVFPGDWVIGGDDGVIVVPQAIAAEALREAEDIEWRGAGMRGDLATGIPFDEAYRKWGRA